MAKESRAAKAANSRNMLDNA